MILFLLVASLGHLCLFVILINRLHGTGLDHSVVKSIDLVWYSLFLLGFGWLVWLGLTNRQPNMFGFAYLTICCLALCLSIIAWARRSKNGFQCSLLNSNHTREVDLIARIGSKPTGQLKSRLAALLPRNEIFKLQVNEKELVLPRLDSALDGISIVHFSDLHLTGQLLPSFYKEVVAEASKLGGDFIAVTGDIIDKRPCLDWIDEIFAPLQAAHGVFYVLGNHDLRIHDVPPFRKQLTNLGWTDLGEGRQAELKINGRSIALCGNERPWFKSNPVDPDWPKGLNDGEPLRIALSHSPDQFRWAQRNDVDLMLAGHTHGGQIRIPLIGPSFSPSLFGAEYASGTFFKQQTLMHVSRGIAGTRPLRINCPPELTKLILKCGS